MFLQVLDEIQKLKIKEPNSNKIIQLEQELVRAEAQSLVAEAQLTNIVSAHNTTLKTFPRRVSSSKYASSMTNTRTIDPSKNEGSI